ncbi:hypothetical protein ET495_12570 [Xylanimonas allomyrinae]|uniref:Uncharacterized protein n=1 Tax=Xylanimonas allomyrinae TaxID=2509459 RepID=A0A4P6END6_9MICO|nr:hypothetical protein [Xylanimonas allomyrinae]QAY63926.1 hypothetical protein ET495_12570 [Xylanimonas allomyrinae]
MTSLTVVLPPAACGSPGTGAGAFYTVTVSEAGVGRPRTLTQVDADVDSESLLTFGAHGGVRSLRRRGHPVWRRAHGC